MKNLQQTIIQFPNFILRTRDGHKLRGYFGQLFKEHSAILSNHFEDGKLRYEYPLVQYKVIDRIPHLVALDEGAKLLNQLFIKIKEINIDGFTAPVLSKEIEARQVDIGYIEQLQEYRFQTPWLCLNQKNYQKYQYAGKSEQMELLKRILIGNILSFYKSFDLRLEQDQRIMVMPKVEKMVTKFKGKRLLAFEGSFVANVLLPPKVGIGRSVARGFGTLST